MSHTPKSFDLQTSVNDISDDQILSLCNEEAKIEQGFKLLMQKYQERLYWHVRRMVFEHDDANDVIQNTFIKVFKSIHKFYGLVANLPAFSHFQVTSILQQCF